MLCVEIIKDQRSVKTGFIKNIERMRTVANEALTSHWAPVTMKEADKLAIVTAGHNAIDAFAAKESGRYASPSSRRLSKDVTIFTLLEECDQLLSEFQKEYVPHLHRKPVV